MFRSRHLDLFATRANAKIPLYVSRFQTRWLGSRTPSKILGTICPLMPSLRLLCSGRFCRGFFSRLTSHWFWWLRCGPSSGLPTSCLCWFDEPLKLPQVRNLLVQPHVREFHQGLGILQLYTWKLSSDLSKRQAFRRRLCELQLLTSGAQLLPCTSLSGPASWLV